MGRHIPYGSSPPGKFLVWLKDNMACDGLIPGKSQSIGSNRKLKASRIFLPNFYVRSIEWFFVNGALGNVWPDLEISEAFVIGLEVPFSADFTSRSWVSNFFMFVSRFSRKVSNLPLIYFVDIFFFLFLFYIVHSLVPVLTPSELAGWRTSACLRRHASM